MQRSFTASSSSSSSSSTSVTFKPPPKNIVITDNLLVGRKSKKQKIEELIASNKREQQRLGNNVILSGFTHKPNHNAVAQNLFTKFNLPSSSTGLCYQFFTKNEETTVFHVVISLKDKSAHIRILNAVASQKLKASDLMTLRGDKIDVEITCQKQLSEFNSLIKKQLKGLKENKIIIDVKFERYFYHFKQSENSYWKEVTHSEILESLMMQLRKKLFWVNQDTTSE